MKLGSLVYSEKNHGNLTEAAKNEKVVSKLQTVEAWDFVTLFGISILSQIQRVLAYFDLMCIVFT